MPRSESVREKEEWSVERWATIDRYAYSVIMDASEIGVRRVRGDREEMGKDGGDDSDIVGNGRRRNDAGNPRPRNPSIVRLIVAGVGVG